ncbi:MAG TPA: hypothetical protein VK654_17710 [Nitrospirota bacterium]|nr:hypothetical protein [Nitrospirota bacterium]
MGNKQDSSITQEQEQELIDILIDSKLYLEMDLAERRKLLDYLAESYCRQTAK